MPSILNSESVANILHQIQSEISLTIILLASVLLQVIAAIIAARQIIEIKNNYRFAWACVCLGLIFMVERRLAPLWRLFEHGQASNMSDAIFGLVISIFMLVGNYGLRALFKNRELERLQLDEVVRNLEIFNKTLSFENEEKQKRAYELQITNKKLESSLLETITLARQLGEMRDFYTAGHEQSVGNLSEAIASELGVEKSIQDGIKVGGYLHDVGKIIVPIEILVKPTKLTIKEFELVKEHVEAGYNVLKDISFPWPVARMVLEHHERLDGSGYPHGLKGDEISIGGKIMAVADVVDSMSTNRPYRRGLGIESALSELKRGSGILYDKAVVDACIKLFNIKGYKLK